MLIDEVGPMPTPKTEEPEKFPGGADALGDQSRYGEIPDGPMGVDLPPDLHPHTNVPDAITEPDEKSQDPELDEDEDLDPPEPTG